MQVVFLVLENIKKVNIWKNPIYCKQEVVPTHHT